MLQNKGFSRLALIIIAVLILGGGYWVWQNQTVTPPSALPEGEGTLTSPLGGGLEGVENWKTYTDSELGLSFKYPATWRDPERRIQSTRININFGNGFSVTSGGYYDQDKQRNLTIDEIVNSLMSNSYFKDFKRETLNLAGSVSTKVSFTTLTARDIEVYIPKSSQSDMVAISSDQTIDATTFTNILSTFRFIK